jgi:hypothetical protein
LRELPITYIRHPVALVRDLASLVGDLVALVGHPVVVACATLSPLKLAS